MAFRAKRLHVLFGAASVLAVGCGDGGVVMQPTGEDPPVVREPLATPSVRLVSPWQWSAGDFVTVLGNDFVSPDRGYTMLYFDGQFTEAGGTSRKVEMGVRATYRTAGKVEFQFEPVFPPDGFGHALGEFVGAVTAQNVDEESESPVSAPLAAEVEVGPSLILWRLRPEDDGCSHTPRISATVDGQALRFDVEAIGLTPTTAYTALEFSVAYGDLGGEARVVTKRLTAGTRTELEADPGLLPYGTVSGTVFFNLRVVDGHGTTISRTVGVNLALEHTVQYDGNIRVAELYAPMLVSSCIPGGEYGRSVNFSSGETESRSRSVTLSANVGLSLWVVNVGFGINVNESVSSGTSQSLAMSGEILPGQYGVFYRQTQRLERLGKILHRAVCGETAVVGDARVTDWNWAPDLAVTSNGLCPPAPPSNLPPAQVFP